MSGQDILIDQFRADVERLTAERDAAFEQGRIVGRADVAKYARAIGEIESVVGIVGAVPMPQTVQAVRDLVSRAEKAEREREINAERCLDAFADIARALTERNAERSRAEKAERERDAYKRAKEENDARFMRERDEWKARHDTLADVSRACIATAERERDEARAENDRLRTDLDWHRSESERLSAAMPSGYALLVMHSAVARASFDEGARDTAIDAINRLDAARKGIDRACPPEEARRGPIQVADDGSNSLVGAPIFDCPKCGRHDGGLIAQGLAEPCSSGCFYNAKAVKT